MGPAGRVLWGGAMVLAIVAPWLCSATWGPNPEMIQRLLSIACGAVLLVGWVGFGPRVGARMLAEVLAWGWLLAALLSAAAGVLQYFGAEGVVFYNWISASTPGQAYANLRQRNQFASLTSLGLVALLYLCTVHATEDGQGRTLRKFLLVLGMALLAVGNAASSSRTGVLQWGLLVAAAWVWSRHGAREVWRWTLGAAAMYVLAAVLLPLALQAHTGSLPTNALERFQQESGCGDRSVLWRNVLELVALKPWLGWGWGELKFAHFITPFQGARFCALVDNAHNLPLHLAVELGVPAAVLLCGGALAAVLWATPWRDTDPARQMAWAALATVAVHSLLEYPLWYGPFQLAVLLSFVLLWRTRRGARSRPAPGVQRETTVALATLILAMVAYAGWDYRRLSQLFLPESMRAEAYRQDTLRKVQDSWLFEDTVRFAWVTTTAPTAQNAAALYTEALKTLHFSPEAKVIEPLLESARLLGLESEATERIRQQWQAQRNAEASSAP